MTTDELVAFLVKQINDNNMRYTRRAPEEGQPRAYQTAYLDGVHDALEMVVAYVVGEQDEENPT